MTWIRLPDRTTIARAELAHGWDLSMRCPGGEDARLIRDLSETPGGKLALRPSGDAWPDLDRLGAGSSEAGGG
jgi:hypothetical protein